MWMCGGWGEVSTLHPDRQLPPGAKTRDTASWLHTITIIFPFHSNIFNQSWRGDIKCECGDIPRTLFMWPPTQQWRGRGHGPVSNCAHTHMATHRTWTGHRTVSQCPEKAPTMLVLKDHNQGATLTIFAKHNRPSLMAFMDKRPNFTSTYHG